MRRTTVVTPSLRGIGAITEDIADIGVGENEGSLATPKPPLDRLEWLLLVAFALVSFWVIGVDLVQVVVHHRTWTGTDGVYITDQMQYLSWIVSASHSGLAANLFVEHPTSAVYLQPAILISGMLAAIGVPPTIALLIWKPIAVGAFFLAGRALAVRVVREPRRGARVVALTLALFYGCLTTVYGQLGVVGELFPGFLSWGYPFTLLAVAAAIYALLSYDRARAEGRVSLAPGFLAALTGSLHPWQGEVFVLMVVGAEVFGGGLRWQELRHPSRSPRVRLAGLSVGLALVPLVYYFSLSKLNIDWQLGQAASAHNFPAISIAVALAPLAVVAVLGLTGPAGGFLGRATRLWPLAAVFIYIQARTTPGGAALHAFDGVTLPLALLAVNGYTWLRSDPGRLRRLWPRSVKVRWLALLGALALATLPATYEELREAWVELQPGPGNPNFILRSEKHALAYLRHDRDPGGVISSQYLGMMVPGYTGRRTYDGDCIWSEPDCDGRTAITQSLLAGKLDKVDAQQVVASSHAHFVLLACGSATAKLEFELRPLTSSVVQFGCASVIELSQS